VTCRVEPKADILRPDRTFGAASPSRR
jgi:hypothetical protein